MKDITELYSEAKSNSYEIYHSSYAGAATEAYDLAEKRGYQVDPDSWAKEVNMGPKKPSAGKYNEINVLLLKNSKPVKHMLVFQVYNLESDTSGGSRKKPYELTTYIS